MKYIFIFFILLSGITLKAQTLRVSNQYGFYWFKPSSKGNSNTFNVSAGSAIYFNSSVGLEFLVGYYSTKETIRYVENTSIARQTGMQVSIGFQIHLQK